ncbi:M56 family metallopeptidase [Nonomuraea sp. NPDC003201]
MSPESFLPALVLAALTLLLSRRQPRLHPKWIARALVVLSASAALAVIGTLVLIIVVAAQPNEGGHGSAPLPLAFTSAALLALTIVHVLATARRWRRDLRTATGLVNDERPFAIAVPGRQGGVTVSTGLLGLLSSRELEVVFRHEETHLRHRHHLYLAAATVTAKIFPPLALAAGALRYTLERWADEDAAAAVGDRKLTARTIAKVALAYSNATPQAGFASSHTSRRVAALLSETPPDSRVAGPLLLGGSWMMMGGTVTSALQLHHLGLLLLLA